ncbi:MAG: hypothetical protein ACRDV1_10815 [Actinomycetes bacterium]
MIQDVAAEIGRAHIEDLRREAAEYRLARSARVARKARAPHQHRTHYASRVFWQVRRTLGARP